MFPKTETANINKFLFHFFLCLIVSDFVWEKKEAEILNGEKMIAEKQVC